MVTEKGRKTLKTRKDLIIMKSVSIIKLSKGYYVEKRIGCNVTREWRKTKASAEALKKEWEVE